MRRKQSGLELIEVLIILAIVSILGSVVFGAVKAQEEGTSTGVNGFTETRCIAGYTHTVGEGGHARQVLDEQGHGIRCN